MSALKPCPFCGSEPHVQKNGVPGQREFWEVVCHECDYVAFDTLSKDGTIEAWNRRTSAPAPGTAGGEVALGAPTMEEVLSWPDGNGSDELPDDPSMWRFWNRKAQELAEKCDRLTASLDQATRRAEDQFANIVELGETIRTLKAERDTARKALEQFARVGDNLKAEDGWAGTDSLLVIEFDDTRLAQIDLSYFWAAREALSSTASSITEKKETRDV